MFTSTSYCYNIWISFWAFVMIPKIQAYFLHICWSELVKSINWIMFNIDILSIIPLWFRYVLISFSGPWFSVHQINHSCVPKPVLCCPYGSSTKNKIKIKEYPSNIMHRGLAPFGSEVYDTIYLYMVSYTLDPKQA